MKKGRRHISGIFLILSGILLMAAFFRFFNYSSWAFFGLDQEYEAFLAKNIVNLTHFPLGEVHVSGTGIFSGPVYIYISAMLYLIFGGNPLGWTLFASAVGVVTTYVVYRVAKSMFTQNVGIFSSLFYACSFLVSFYDRKFWNVTLIPFFSLLTGFFLYKIAHGDYKKLILLSLVFAISVQHHLSMLIFLPLIVYMIWVYRKKIPTRIFIWSAIIFLLIQMPVIIFDLKNNFITSRTIIGSVTGTLRSHDDQLNLAGRNSLFLSSMGRFFWVPPKPDVFVELGQCNNLSWLKKNSYPEGIIFVFSGIFIFAWWFIDNIKKQHENHRTSFTLSAKIVLLIFLMTVLSIQIHRRFFFEYYLLFFFPWLAIALGRSVDLIWQKKHGTAIIMPFIYLFIFLNFFTLFSSSFSYSYQDKINAIQFVKQHLNGEDYVLEALGECTRFGGYRYLFERNIYAPVQSYMDSYFNRFYSASKSEKAPQKLILLSLIDPRLSARDISGWEEKKVRYLTEYRILDNSRFGSIQVFILALKNYGG